MVLAGLVATTASSEPRRSCLELKKTARFTVYFDRVDLETLVQTVSDATCRSFILTEGLKGKVSIVGPENGKLQLDADQFYAAFLGALDANGFTVVPQGRFLRVVEKRNARQFPVPLALEPGGEGGASNEVSTRLYRLQHLELEPLRPALMAFLSNGGDLVALPPDLIIVTDLWVNQQRLAEVLRKLDVPRASTETIRLVKVHHASAETLVEQVSRALVPKGPTKEPLAVFADERTNRVILIGGPTLLDRAERLIGELDLEVPGDARARVVKLKNADAKELASTLEAMTSANRKQPGAQTTSEVRISVNESLNALLIVSNGSDYRALSDVIEQLDQPVRQVFIETVIMEVNLSRDSKFGVSAHGTGGNASAAGIVATQPEGAASSLAVTSLAQSSGLLFGIQGPVLSQIADLLGIRLPQFGLTIQASQGTSDVNVLSMPHLLTADNREAEIAVGQRVPFQLGVNQSQLAALLTQGNSSAANLSQLTGSISREKVELKLTVKPHIGEAGDIRLEINQQAEELAGTSSSAGPITSTRSQKTTVVAHDAETLVLGGIMQDREIEQISKVPLLGDIPLLGNLFRNTIKTKSKVNLLVFLTPHVIRGPRDVKRLIERKMAERTKVLDQLSATRAEAGAPTVDLNSRPGPLAAIARALEAEERSVIAPRADQPAE